MTTTLNTLLGNNAPLYNGIFPERPVWGYISTTNGSQPSSTNHFFTSFSKNPWTPMTVTYGSGSSQANVLRTVPEGSNEAMTSGYYFAGSSGTQVSSESFSPQSGYVGCPQSYNTGCGAFFRAFDNGSFNFTYTENFNYAPVHSGIIVGERRFNQTYDLIAYQGKIMKMPIGMNNAYITSPSVNPEFFFSGSNMYTGSQYSSPSGVSKGYGAATLETTTTTANNSSYFRNYGMICHNRNTNKLAYLESSSTTGTWRLHIVDLQNQISQNTTTLEVKTWIESAVAAGSSRYNYYDISLPSWSQAQTVQSSQMMKVILCDDNTMWISGWDKNDSSSGGTMRLYKCTDTSTYATWTSVSTSSTTTSYNIAQGYNYGIRHMNSDDNSRIFIYAPYYYYMSGLVGFIVSTESANASGDDVRWRKYEDQASGAGSRAVVPTGNGDFLVGQLSQNQDGGSGAAGMYLNCSGRMFGDTISSTSLIWRYFPTIGQSTSYQSWFPMKIQPTIEFKPSWEE
jgi:hypothetical protein